MSRSKLCSAAINNVNIYFLFSGDLALSILKGPLEAIVGVLYGVVGGIIIWYIPNRASVSRSY